MCGIVGSFGPAGLAVEWLQEACDALQHRGPDSSGVWRDPAAGIALGHRRLAILDLSAAGQQPMASACGRYQTVFNGEIYNHLELRRALGDRPWRGHSDTETFLECLANWGVARTLQAMVGMFAFAVFDVAERRLVLARDRFGEKPLYYGYAGRELVFASELRALRAAPEFDTTIDRVALASYMRDSCVPAPDSIYASMRKLPAGTWLEVSATQVAARSLPRASCFWSAVDAAHAGQRSLLDIGDVEAAAMLEGLLGDAVRGQMLSDVPLGAFLSGGVDSSLVVALMQAHSGSRVRTFSIGFDESEYDESDQARTVARHLGTDHTELTVRASDVLALVPQMPAVYSEPFADSSQLPTVLLARLARRGVTVALSGDGGDEVFGGYDRYSLGPDAWSSLSRMPYGLRRTLAGGVRAISPAIWDSIGLLLRPLTPSRFRVPMPGDKLHKGAALLASRNVEDLYRQLVSQGWAGLVIGAGDQEPRAGIAVPEMPNVACRLMLFDMMRYLPDDILVKVDRAAMSVGLETRVPILDHRVVEFAWRLPMHMKMRSGQGKWLLRQVLYKHVPRNLVERPKAGFAVPLGAWLRGPLREWAEQLLDAARLRSEGYLDAVAVRRGWDEHLSGRRNWQQQLWNVLMFQTWLEASQ